MKQKDKDLLLQDLCARLPYGVIVAYKNRENKEGRVELGYGNIGYVAELGRGWWVVFKPYLRPMSSMTEEEKNELKEYLNAEEVDFNGFGYIEGGILEDYLSSIPYSLCSYVIDWLNEHHFDYRSLIEKDLALEAPKRMYEIQN